MFQYNTFNEYKNTICIKYHIFKAAINWWHIGFVFVMPCCLILQKRFSTESWFNDRKNKKLNPISYKNFHNSIMNWMVVIHPLINEYWLVTSLPLCLSIKRHWDSSSTIDFHNVKCGEFSDKVHAYFLLLRDFKLFNESNKLSTFCTTFVHFSSV